MLKSLLAWMMVTSFVLTGCATKPVTPVAEIENIAGAITVPYRISSSGRILIDVSVAGKPARPMALDTGATLSVLYGDFATASQLEISEKTRFVRGLVGQGERPVIEDVILQIGAAEFQMDQLVMLETPSIKDEAVGLLGGDIISLYVALFNKETQRASFIPRQNIDAAAFAGWNKVPLETFASADTNSRLYFAKMKVDRHVVPVLIDTGSNLNFINWKLATLDENIQQIERNLIKNGTLQGALDSTSASTVTSFNDLSLGKQNWDQVSVIVMGLGALETVAPVDEPMMVAGAKVFAPHTIAFDLSGLNLFVKP